MNTGQQKTILITGSTDGVGRRTAELLALSGHRILVHGRDAERAQAVVQSIKSTGGEAQSYLSDLSALAGVDALSQTFLCEQPRLDVLINNAGIGFGRLCDGRKLSPDGYELRFAINYLAGFLLTHRLLPRLVAAKGRIVNVASIGQHPIDFDNLMLERRYAGRRAYRRAKLAQILFTIDLAQALESTGVTVNAVHPATEARARLRAVSLELTGLGPDHLTRPRAIEPSRAEPREWPGARPSGDLSATSAKERP
ncbi:SDR family NAD(P)-dependent oxidoreductase [Rhodopseudomonas sp. HC1]|uniref:SDR family NAD(P)-dependent oxidoreductase n=1 Tax=Rhodopseudomonas infernalis TaxID=2897386 RepID=UPI001EE8CC72|nr:SDR family NAD(P)-dependent oxidoreductase [Rhodopseudomonas infernalis]MCG6207468.1 SDR family NAD(P)-dependent oxidoreductase [Rhodopseudomonas infernalis]